MFFNDIDIYYRYLNTFKDYLDIFNRYLIKISFIDI